MWRVGLVAMLMVGCTSGDSVDMLATASDVHVVFLSGASVSDHDVGAVVYLHTGTSTTPAPPPPGGHCLTLDSSFSGTFVGVPMAVVSTGGVDSSGSCVFPKLKTVGVTGRLTTAVVEVRDATKTITMTLDPPSMVESRTATHVAATDGMVHYTWSHPADLAAGARVTFTPSGESPSAWSVQGVVSGDQVAYQVPSGLPIVAGVTVISTDRVEGAAVTCDGAAACTYSIYHDVVLH